MSNTRPGGSGAPSPRLLPVSDAPRFEPLPAAMTSFIGREDEIATVTALLRDGVRLVTLTGPGGVGKTRLALRIAERLDAEYPDGTGFVSLATVTEPSQVLPWIAARLGLRAGEPENRLVALLRHRELLLVLDNVEQVLPAAVDLARMLALCSGLRLLVTSRRRLRVTGEHVIAVPALAWAAPAASSPAAMSVPGDALRLFVERARAACSDFTMTEENAAILTEICSRLDGLPLAIELAAARVNVLAPLTMLVRLEQRLDLLTSGPRDAAPRARTMRDAIAWSYDLLSPEEQAAFRRLSVFSGGFTLEAAEQVLDVAPAPGGEGIVAADTALERITTLIEHSLIQQVQQRDAEPRFVMLETIREYALELLAIHGEEGASRRRQAEFCLMLVHAAGPELHGPRQRHWLDRLEAEGTNLRAALAWTLDAGETALSLRLAAGLEMFWLKRGHVAEGRAWLERALALAGDERSHDRLAALLAAALLGGPRGDAPRAEAACALAQELGDAQGIGRAWFHRGIAALADGRPAEAAGFLAHAADLLARSGGGLWRASALLSLPLAMLQLSDPDNRATAMLEEAIAILDGMGESWGVALAINILASVARYGGQPDQAYQHYAESLELAQSLGDAVIANEALLGLGGVLATTEPRLAAWLFGAAELRRELTGNSLRHLMTRDLYEEDLAVVQQSLAADALAAAWAEGRALRMSEVMDLVRADRPVAAEPKQRQLSLGRSEPTSSLTVREMDVLRLLVEGRTDREIGQALFIGHRTVSTHVGSILGKIGMESRTAAAAYAVRNGLV